MNGIMKECDMRNEMRNESRRRAQKAVRQNFCELGGFDGCESELCQKETLPMSELVAENCNASGFSLAAVAGGILMCLGIILYAIFTH